MKKLITSAIATGILLSSALPVMAEPIESVGGEVNVPSTNLSAELAPEYRVKIPTALNVNMNDIAEGHLFSNSGEFGLVDLNTAGHVKFDIVNEATLNHEEGKDNFNVELRVADLSGDDYQLAATEGYPLNTGNSRLIRMEKENFNTADILSGNYTGTVSFEVSYVNDELTPPAE